MCKCFDTMCFKLYSSRDILIRTSVLNFCLIAHHELEPSNKPEPDRRFPATFQGYGRDNTCKQCKAFSKKNKKASDYCTAENEEDFEEITLCEISSIERKSCACQYDSQEGTRYIPMTARPVRTFCHSSMRQLTPNTGEVKWHYLR